MILVEQLQPMAFLKIILIEFSSLNKCLTFLRILGYETKYCEYNKVSF
jgi:hypothetical protein